jgi:hypothetical protein
VSRSLALPPARQISNTISRDCSSMSTTIIRARLKFLRVGFRGRQPM